MANIISAIKLPNGNKYNIKDEISNYAVQTGSYDDMTVGTAKIAKGFAGTEFKSDSTPYLHRPIDLDDFEVGDRSYNEEIIGGTVAWNQKFMIPRDNTSTTVNGVTIVDNRDGSFTVSTTAEGATAVTYVTSPSLALLSGHKYLCYGGPENPSPTRLNSYVSGMTNSIPISKNGVIVNQINTTTGYVVPVYVATGTVISTPVTIAPNCIDLTALFGSAEIADYVYSLEQTTPGAGVAWLKSHGFIDGSYRAYNSGSLLSVKTSEHRTVGKNLLKNTATSKTEQGVTWTVNADGTITVSGTAEGYTKLSIGMVYVNSTLGTIVISGLANTTNIVWEGTLYDSKNGVLGNFGSAQTVMIDLSEYPTIAKINVVVKRNNNVLTSGTVKPQVEFGSQATTYEPYESHSYPLDSDLELRGPFKLDANNNLYADGDVYESSGAVTRKYGIVDLGTLNWTYESALPRFYTTDLNSLVKKPASNVVANLISSLYTATTFEALYTTEKKNMTMCVSSGGAISIINTAYTDTSAFKTAMSGVYLVYELATPTTETAQPFASPQVVNPLGTEEYIDTRNVPVPVGHQTKYIKSNTGVVTEVMVNGKPVVNEKGVAEISALKSKVDFQEENTTLYLSRPTYKGLGTGNRLDNEEIVGGTVAWNQLADPSNFTTKSFKGVSTTPSGHNYIVNGTATGKEAWALWTSGTPAVIGHKYLFYGAKGGVKLRLGQVDNIFDTGNGAISIATSVNATQMAIVIANGDVYDNVVITPQLIDLTLAFGTEIADYVYSLEQASAGSGIAWLKSYGFFTKDYYPYDPGSTVSVKTTAHRMTGKNRLQVTSPNKTISGVTYTINSDGTVNANGTATDIAWIDLGTVDVVSGEQYVLSGGYSNQIYLVIKGHASWSSKGNETTFTADSSSITVQAVILNGNTANNVKFYPMIRLASVSDATFEPYESHTYQLDPDLELRGRFKLDADNRLYAEGDIYHSVGTVTRTYRLTTIPQSQSVTFRSSGNGVKRYVASLGDLDTPTNKAKVNGLGGLISKKFIKGNGYSGNEPYLAMLDAYALYFTVPDTMSDSDVQNYISLLDLVYELAKPIAETAQPYAKSQVVNPLGIEEYVDERDVPIPVEHKTYYYSSNERGVKDVFINKEPTTDRNGIATINALPLTGGTITGNLVVNGAISCPNNLQINTINGVAVGDNPKFTDTKVIKYTSSSFSSLPQTFTVSGCTTTMECIKAVLSTPSAQGSDWTVNTDTAGKVTLTGTFNGSTATTITLYLADIG